MSNQENNHGTERPQTLGSILHDLAQRLIPRLQAFERSLREFVVAAEPYIANFVANVETLPRRISAVQKLLACRGWFIPPEVPALDFVRLVEQHAMLGRWSNWTR